MMHIKPPINWYYSIILITGSIIVTSEQRWRKLQMWVLSGSLKYPSKTKDVHFIGCRPWMKTLCFFFLFFPSSWDLKGNLWNRSRDEPVLTGLITCCPLWRLLKTAVVTGEKQKTAFVGWEKISVRFSLLSHGINFSSKCENVANYADDIVCLALHTECYYTDRKWCCQ